MTLDTVAMILCCLLMLLLVAQMAPVFGLLRLMRRWRGKSLPDEQCPAAAVILCLRGADPFLEETLKHLFDLDYPNYQVRIVVDSREDPAWELVHTVIQQREPTNVHVEPLQNRRDTCGLKNSSLLQAVASLDDSIEMVAFLDADAVPHRTWLRDLAAPLADKRVAASSGQRWYMPRAASVGALIRYIWNAGNLVAMSTKSVWGGSFAIKSTALADSGLLEDWKTSLAEDVLVYGAVRRAGYRMAFVPSAILVNRESCSVKGFFRWIQRQILLGRLYHFAWPLILVHGIISTCALLAAFTLCGLGIVHQDATTILLLVGTLLGYLAAMMLLFLVLERAVRRTARDRDEPVGWFSFRAALKCLVAIPLTQFVYTAALIKAALMRRVEWRGIVYQVDDSSQIHMVQYTPYQSPESTEAKPGVSV